MSTTALAPRRRILPAALWVAQALLALFFIGTGLSKLASPAADLAASIPWVGEHPALATLTGIVDLLGGVGIVLPALLRIAPRLTVLAGWGLLALQAVAMAFHLSRGEVAVLPLNVVLIAVVAFVVWGRSRALPIAAR